MLIGLEWDFKGETIVPAVSVILAFNPSMQASSLTITWLTLLANDSFPRIAIKIKSINKIKTRNIHTIIQG